ncbi:MAG: hypothetical protein IJ628_09415 [Bacteroidaceae bacterium]|nr:hypothetical protein [Bacteroidaceae bacterium]MBR1542810.1 hypothetical protein [Bacteroidaceae bacterium]
MTEITIKRFMVLYTFNPDTDLALANGKGNYTPTDPVKQMIQDLAALPIWYAEPGSQVLADSIYNEEFLMEMKEFFPLDVSLIPLNTLKYIDEPIEVCPWGWNHSFRNMLARAGVGMEYLPSDFELDEQRKLSQRKTVSTVLELFKDEEGFCGLSRNVLKTSGCEKYYNMMSDLGGVVFKEPWSSSGKGLLWCRDGFTEKDRNWCQRVIDTQGYVTMSPIYNKVQDFAMEFYVDDQHANEVTFLGYSLFDTDMRGSYKGNALLDSVDIERYLTDYVPLEWLQRAKQLVGGFLGIYGFRACVGVDMMICDESKGMCIHPCVEINYRSTMGYLALHLKETFLTKEAHGRFMIQHFHSPQELAAFVKDSKQKAPLQVRGGKVKSGFLPLVPVTPTSQNLAFIDVY